MNEEQPRNERETAKKEPRTREGRTPRTEKRTRKATHEAERATEEKKSGRGPLVGAPRVSGVAGFPRTAGRPQLFETPDELGDRFDDFLEWRDNNPLKGSQVIKKGEVISYDIRRPLTLEGFCRFAGMRSITFREYEKKDEFSDVCTGIRDAIRADQLEAALANQVNPMIAARVLKLKDGADITSNGQQIAAAPQAIHLTYNGADFSITPEDLDE